MRQVIELREMGESSVVVEVDGEMLYEEVPDVGTGSPVCEVAIRISLQPRLQLLDDYAEQCGAHFREVLHEGGIEFDSGAVWTLCHFCAVRQPKDLEGKDQVVGVGRATGVLFRRGWERFNERDDIVDVFNFEKT